MKKLLTLLFSFSLFTSFSQVGSFRKVETTDLRLRTLLNTDVTKFLTTNSTGKVVLATLNTTSVAEGTNLYFTNARARTAISLTTTGTSGAATYNSSTGILNVPNYVTPTPTLQQVTTAGNVTNLEINAHGFQLKNDLDQFTGGLALLTSGSNQGGSFFIKDVNTTNRVTVRTDLNLTGSRTINLPDQAGKVQINQSLPTTPTSSSDTQGYVGEILWDNNYMYIKIHNSSTNNDEWRRTAHGVF